MKDTNILTVEGYMNSCLPFFSHETEHGSFYCMKIENKRKSGVSDFVHVIMEEELAIKIHKEVKELGTVVRLIGEIRTINDGRLRVFMYLRYFEVLKEIPEVLENKVSLEGTLCKSPIYRTTPLKKNITDLVIASNRSKGSSYIPVITWGATAKYCSNLRIGDKIYLEGRFQSRDYENLKGEKRTVYEVSVLGDLNKIVDQ